MAVPSFDQRKHLTPSQQLVLDSLNELGDVKFQERVWLHRDGAEVSSPSELINQLFDDSGLSDLLERGSAFSSVADSLLRQMSELVDRINLQQPISALLEDALWLELRRLAVRALDEVTLALLGDVASDAKQD